MDEKSAADSLMMLGQGVVSRADVTPPRKNQYAKLSSRTPPTHKTTKCVPIAYKRTSSHAIHVICDFDDEGSGSHRVAVKLFKGESEHKFRQRCRRVAEAMFDDEKKFNV
jgi:hypothetical protein